jgi:predicted amidohydrolase YtcJ
MTYNEANLLPKNHPANKDYTQFLNTFGEEGNLVIIGVKDKIGSINIGKLADFVAVDGNPEQDISVIATKMVFVMKDGKVYVNKLK